MRRPGTSERATTQANDVPTMAADTATRVASTTVFQSASLVTSSLITVRIATSPTTTRETR